MRAKSPHPRGASCNNATQRRHTWPAEPAVALAYLDQLRRSDALPAAQAGALTTTLGRAADLLAGGTGDAAVATELEELASTLAPEGTDQSDTTRTRFAALAATVADIADRLR